VQEGPELGHQHQIHGNNSHDQRFAQIPCRFSEVGVFSHYLNAVALRYFHGVQFPLYVIYHVAERPVPGVAVYVLCSLKVFPGYHVGPLACFHFGHGPQRYIGAGGRGDAHREQVFYRLPVLCSVAHRDIGVFGVDYLQFGGLHALQAGKHFFGYVGRI